MRDLDKRARARAISLDDPEPDASSNGVAPSTSATTPAPVSPLHVRTNTAPGALAKFMVDKSETHKENTALKARLAEFEDADPVRLIDPKAIVATRWANRIDASFQGGAFAQLKAEIASAGGNVQPIKVRAREGGKKEGQLYEIVYGHRRHRACLELGIPVSAVIATGIDDQTLYLEMERENRNREDLSAWEQGTMYARALEGGLFASIRQLAAAIDRDQSQVGKALALAKLPADVVAAFASPLDLQFRWSAALKEAMQKDPDGVLARARSIKMLSPRPAPPAVFAMLLSAADLVNGQGDGDDAAQSVRWNGANGKKIAVMKADRKGRVTLAIGQPLDLAKRKELGKLIDAFLKGSVRAP